MKNLIIFFILLLFTSCSSPQNNRVYEDQGQSGHGVETLSFSNGKYSLQAEWLEGPFGTSTKSSEILVIVRGADGARASLSDELGFYAWMPSMGHPMADAGYFEEVSTGVYINSTIKFNMGGEWEMSLRTLDEDFNIKDEVKWLETL